jgi:hypothetical protein
MKKFYLSLESRNFSMGIDSKNLHAGGGVTLANSLKKPPINSNMINKSKLNLKF